MELNTQSLVANASVAEDHRFAQPQDALEVESSYDGSNAVYRLMRMETWGPALMNLGYYRFCGLLGFLNAFVNEELAQRRLIMRSIDLLNVNADQRVLDVACGRGKSSFMVRCIHPDVRIVGLDLLERNIQVARTLFDRIDGLTYVVGDAMKLDFADASFDRIMCIEAAFHFPDRSQFFEEAYRCLQPGGRLVVVDFVWKTDADRRHRLDVHAKLVREIWQWDDLYSAPDYPRVAAHCGFRTTSQNDWSRNVTGAMHKAFEILSFLGNREWGRRLLEWRNPLYRSFSRNDWAEIARAVSAHRHMQAYTNYMAFVFEKPHESRC